MLCTQRQQKNTTHLITIPLPKERSNNTPSPLLPPRVMIQNAQQNEGVDVHIRDREGVPAGGIGRAYCAGCDGRNGSGGRGGIK